MLGAIVEPFLGVAADAGHRRPIVLIGGVVFAIGMAAFALAWGYPALLVGALVMAPASGAFVSLSQATLMDLDPTGHERGMARWVVAGSIGVLIGPLTIAGAASLGLGWRGPIAVFAVGTLAFVWAARLIPFAGNGDHRGFASVARDAVRALRRFDVVRWLLLLQATDLLGDVLFGYLALYFVDVVRVDPVVGGLAVVVWAAAGLAGDILLLPVLARVNGVRYLRASAAAVALVFPLFLVVPGVVLKLVLLAMLALLHAGWYAIPQGRLFTAMSGSSGSAIALSDVADLLGRLAPVGIGVLAERAGLGIALWLLMLAPIALLVGLPRWEDPPAPV
jgi:MFS transporter, FSR family, fosmidomycin resistance protein